MLHTLLYTDLNYQAKVSILRWAKQGDLCSMTDGRVDSAYEKLKAMAVGFEVRPGDRLNEVALSRVLGISRTPLREALNRLVAEKLFDFRPGQGFYCRGFDQQTIFDLFELRTIIETAAIRLACERADVATLHKLQDVLYETGLSVDGLTVAEACARDEDFHVGIAEASGNHQLVRSLIHVNEQVRYVRWVRMVGDRITSSKEEHKRIMAALLGRDKEGAEAAMASHILGRKDQIADAVRQGISTIYLEPEGALAARILEDETA